MWVIVDDGDKGILIMGVFYGVNDVWCVFVGC